jgi:predicted nuclease of predicted toxin-antitoxin system
MRFLANENVPLATITALRERAHDVIWIRTAAPGSSDEDILSRGVAEGRIVITFDKDFGEPAFRSHLPSQCGIILFRIQGKSSENMAKVVVSAIESRSDWIGHFSVIEEHLIRMRPL